MARTINAKEMKEWEETTCPICMEPPHHAILLKCSSHDKGCRPYICNTSRRHSNCLDKFRNSSTKPSPDHRLRCPLCRGPALNSLVIEPARVVMDSKVRGCSEEGCEFTGTYQDLRWHARDEHSWAREARDFMAQPDVGFFLPPGMPSGDPLRSRTIGGVSRRPLRDFRVIRDSCRIC